MKHFRNLDKKKFMIYKKEFMIQTKKISWFIQKKNHDLYEKNSIIYMKKISWLIRNILHDLYKKKIMIYSKNISWFIRKKQFMPIEAISFLAALSIIWVTLEVVPYLPRNAIGRAAKLWPDSLIGR